MVEEIMPPTMGAAKRLMTSEPVPVPHKMGRAQAYLSTLAQDDSIVRCWMLMPRRSAAFFDR